MPQAGSTETHAGARPYAQGVSGGIVIVGGGLASARVVENYREAGGDEPIVLVSADTRPPYHRPPLSKRLLRGEQEADDALVEPRDFYAEHDVDLRLETWVERLDLSGRRLELRDGEALPFDRLVIASGAFPRRLPVPGADLDGVHVLRTLADSDALRELLMGGGSLAIVGAGWIGCEVAASARGHGAEVTLIEASDAPLERVLGRTLGEFFAGVHRSHGVRLLTGAGVERIAGAGRAERLELRGGEVVECDAVLLGVGVAPDTRLAEAAGLEVDDGIVTDEHLHTSAPDVFAAGDVASALHPRYGRHVRVEHWANALNQGAAAGRSMLGGAEPYARLPYFFTDQYELGMEYAGLHSPGDRLVLRGTPGDGPFVAFWLDAAGRPTAGMHVDDWDAIEPIKALVERGEPVDEARLADPGVPLDAVIEPAR